MSVARIPFVFLIDPNRIKGIECADEIMSVWLLNPQEDIPLYQVEIK